MVGEQPESSDRAGEAKGVDSASRSSASDDSSAVSKASLLERIEMSLGIEPVNDTLAIRSLRVLWVSLDISRGR
jgi:hypothetical protein